MLIHYMHDVKLAYGFSPFGHVCLKHVFHVVHIKTDVNSNIDLKKEGCSVRFLYQKNAF